MQNQQNYTQQETHFFPRLLRHGGPAPAPTSPAGPRRRAKNYSSLQPLCSKNFFVDWKPGALQQRTGYSSAGRVFKWKRQSWRAPFSWCVALRVPTPAAPRERAGPRERHGGRRFLQIGRGAEGRTRTIRRRTGRIECSGTRSAWCDVR